MTEAQLESLRRELEKAYRKVNKEYLDKQKQKPYFWYFFNSSTKEAKIKEELKALEETRDAIRKFQTAIARGSTETVENQKEAYKKLLDVEKKYNYDTGVSKLNVNQPLLNTLKVHHNRSVEKNVKHPVATFLKKAALAFIPLAAIPLLPAIGLGAAGAALATPLAWAGVALGGRAIVHSVQGWARKVTMRNVSRSRGMDVKHGKLIEYEELYPTMSHVKGIVNTYRYNRTLRNSVGKTFQGFKEMDDFNDFERLIGQNQQTQQQPQQQNQNQQQNQRQNQNTNQITEQMIRDFINAAPTLDLDDLDNLLRISGIGIPQMIGFVANANLDQDTKDKFELAVRYVRLATGIRDRQILNFDPQRNYVNIDPNFLNDILNIMGRDDSSKSREYNEYRELLYNNLRELCIRMNYDPEFMNICFPVQRQASQQMGQQQLGPQQTGPQGPGSNPPGENNGSNDGNGSNGSNDGTPPSENEKGDDPTKLTPPEPQRRPNNSSDETYARTPELQKLVYMLREFDSSKMTIDNYNAANKLIAKIDGAYRIHGDDFYLDNDDEMLLAEVRSMADAYESKTDLVDKLKVCEASISAGAFYKEAFEDCIKEFYNIVGHTTYVSDGKKSTAVRTATSRNLLSREEYERVKKVLQYYKKYSDLTNKSEFADIQVQVEESVGRSR